MKHLYLANDTHTDLMWNGDEDAWYPWNYNMALFYLKIGEQTQEQAPESRSKWNYDVAWTLYMMSKRAPTDVFERIVAQFKTGQASVPYDFTLAVYGASTLEGVLRSFYPAGHLERDYGIEIEMGVAQENATLPLGLASLWAGSGAKYSWRGVCNCATNINTVGKRDHEIYWYTGMDDQRVLMKWYSNYGWNADLGGYAEMLEPTLAVQNMDKLCGSEGYPYAIAGAFGKGWDNIHNYSYDLVWGLKHRTLPGTKVHLSNQIDFFEHFAADYGEALPEVTLAYGNEWDLNLASLAEVNGQIRRSIETLRTAEAMAAVVADRGVFDDLSDMKDDFLYGISVYPVHGWTADGPMDRHDFATYMRAQADKVTDYVDALQDRAAGVVGEVIDAGSVENAVFVFNALNWPRSGYVIIPLGGDFNTARDVETGKVLTGTVQHGEFGDALRVWVDDVPGAGYRLVALVHEVDTDRIPARGRRSDFEFDGGIIETPFYRADVTRSGALASLYDKQLGREWAQGLLNDLGGDPNDGVPVQVKALDDKSITLVCESDAPVKHRCEITFYADDPRIDFDNTITENFDAVLHWAFDFDVVSPEVWHEEVGAIIKAKTASKGGHYADRMARYDYLTLNHFLNVGNAGHSITLSSADCLFFKLGKSTPVFLDEDASAVHVLIGGQVNENLGMVAQDGDEVFRQHLALIPHGEVFDAGVSMRAAMAHQNGFGAGTVSPGGEWTGATRSFFTCDAQDVLLWALKPGEVAGVTARLWHVGLVPAQASVTLDVPHDTVMLATHVETDIEPLTVNEGSVALTFSQQQVKTVRFISDRNAHGTAE